MEVSQFFSPRFVRVPPRPANKLRKAGFYIVQIFHWKLDLFMVYRTWTLPLVLCGLMLTGLVSNVHAAVHYNIGGFNFSNQPSGLINIADDAIKLTIENFEADTVKITYNSANLDVGGHQNAKIGGLYLNVHNDLVNPFVKNNPHGGFTVLGVTLPTRSLYFPGWIYFCSCIKHDS